MAINPNGMRVALKLKRWQVRVYDDYNQLWPHAAIVAKVDI